MSTKPNLVTLIQITSKYYVSVPRTRVQYIARVLLTPSVNRDLLGGTGGTIHHVNHMSVPLCRLLPGQHYHIHGPTLSA